MKAKPKPKAKPRPRTAASANASKASKPRATAGRTAAKRKAPTQRAPRATPDRWRRFVEQYGVVLASARGPVPNLAEQVAGEPIIGSWWSHPDAHEIFDALSRLDDDLDVRCFRLVDGKVTFVHRRLWPALVRLARDGVLGPERVAAIQQEHMPTGEHRNLVTPFPDWVPEDTAEAADALTVDSARSRLGSWL